MDDELPPTANYDLNRLVDEAQSDLLTSQSVIATDEVVRWIEDTAGYAVPAKEVKSALFAHPYLVTAALGGGLWKRGINPGPPKLNPISSGRR